MPRKSANKDDNIARIVHLELCQKFGLVGEVKWYNHKPASVVGNGRVKILWDFNIQTDHDKHNNNNNININNNNNNNNNNNIITTKPRYIISSVNKNQIYSTYPMFIFVKLAFGGHCLRFQPYTINSMI